MVAGTLLIVSAVQVSVYQVPRCQAHSWLQALSARQDGTVERTQTLEPGGLGSNPALPLAGQRSLHELPDFRGSVSSPQGGREGLMS